MFLSKSQMIVGASAVAVFTLQGCSSNDDTTPDLGTPCTVGGNQCDGGPEGLVCQAFGDESYCTLPCVAGELGTCESGEQGSDGSFVCENGFCEKAPDEGPQVQLGDDCQVGAMGTCGNGTEAGPSGFECEEDFRTKEQYCTQECSLSDLGACGESENPPSGFECVAANKKIGTKAYCLRVQQR
jgi:hypothetical protein